MRMFDRSLLCLLVIGMWVGIGLYLTRPDRVESQSIDLNLIKASVIRTIESTCKASGYVTISGTKDDSLKGEMLDGKISCNFP
jgi:hypothetical protein